mgnify:CR=1 FL=1
MVTTDSALRQLDESSSTTLPNVAHVVCYELPSNMQEYSERVRCRLAGNPALLQTIKRAIRLQSHHREAWCERLMIDASYRVLFSPWLHRCNALDKEAMSVQSRRLLGTIRMAICYTSLRRWRASSLPIICATSLARMQDGRYNERNRGLTCTF